MTNAWWAVPSLLLAVASAGCAGGATTTESGGDVNGSGGSTSAGGGAKGDGGVAGSEPSGASAGGQNGGGTTGTSGTGIGSTGIGSTGTTTGSRTGGTGSTGATGSRTGSSGTPTGTRDGGTSGAGGNDASIGPIQTSGNGPKIPAATEACQQLAGLNGTNVTVLGQQVQIWSGQKNASGSGGPVFFYWHGTGSSSSEAQFMMGAQIQEVVSDGGLFASFSTSTTQGQDTGDAVWYTGDFAMADQILACAVQQLNIDTRRIYTGGCSAGGLQSGAMLYGRSSYLAAVMPNSGGTVFPYQMQDSHVPALITTHGAAGTDVVIVDFSQTSATEDNDVKSKGGFVVDCNHGGGHCGAPPADIAGQWQFCKDHPFGVSPEPYANGLPSTLPSYCTIIK